MKDCEHGCKGTRHLWDSEKHVWKKCMCLLIEARNIVCQKARIPEEYWDLTVSQLTAFTPETKLVKNQMIELRKTPIKNTKVKGPSYQAKLISHLLLKSQLINKWGLYCSLDEVTNWFLTHDKRQFSKVRNCRVLALFFGDEYTQQVHKYLLNHLIQYRQEPRFKTIWVTSIVNSMALGNVYGFDFDQSVPGTWVNVSDASLV